MPAGIAITNTDHTSCQLRLMARKCKGANHSRRLLAIAGALTGDLGRTAIAEHAGVGLQTLRDWILRDNGEGPLGLQTRQGQGRPSILDLNRLQEGFRRDFHRIARNHLPPGMDPNRVDVRFQDEARIGQKDMLSRVWALKGTRPGIPRDCRHGYCHLFSAVCPATGEAVGHVCDRANASGMNRHLKDIGSMFPKGRHALVVFDGAGWHRSKDLACPDNVSVLRVPPYPPELNPAGNVFRFLKSNHCANRVFETADEVKATVRKVWEDFAGQSERIKSIGQRSWAKLQWKPGKIGCEIWRCLLMVTFEKWYKMWNGDCKNIQIGWMARTIF